MVELCFNCDRVLYEPYKIIHFGDLSSGGVCDECSDKISKQDRKEIAITLLAALLLLACYYLYKLTFIQATVE